MNIYEIGVLISIILVTIGALLAFYIAPAIWTWKDAKEHGFSTWLWTAVVVLLQAVGSFLCFGFFLYLIVRSVNSKHHCPECNARFEPKAKFCGSCGQEIDYEKVAKFGKKHNRWLWGILIGGIMMLLGGGLFCISTYYSVPGSFENTSVGKIENSWGDVWTVKARKSTERMSKTIYFKEEDHGTVTIEGGCSEGTVTLNIIGNNKTDTFVLSDTDVPLIIDLNEYTGNSVELMLVNDAVANLEFKADWK